MLVKILIVLAMLGILFSLSTGLFYLISDKGDGKRTVKALTWRIGLSLTLFILLMIGFWTGIIAPHGVGG